LLVEGRIISQKNNVLIACLRLGLRILIQKCLCSDLFTKWVIDSGCIAIIFPVSLALFWQNIRKLSLSMAVSGIGIDAKEDRLSPRPMRNNGNKNFLEMSKETE